MGAGSTIRFTGKLIRENAASWTLLPMPKDSGGQAFSREETMVEGTIEGFPFRAPLSPDGLQISESLLAAIRAGAGDEVDVELTRVGDEPEVRVPPDFQAAIDAAPAKIQALWQEITPMARREWVRWIASAKQEATRVKRIEVGLDKMSKGMRRPCCFPGINFVTKDLVPAEETWVALPAARSKKSA